MQMALMALSMPILEVDTAVNTFEYAQQISTNSVICEDRMPTIVRVDILERILMAARWL